MKRATMLTIILSVFIIASYAYAHGLGIMGGSWNYCPYCGQHIGPHGGYGMMGPGMMGHGMMGPGHYGQSEECQKFLNENTEHQNL